jgi:hypothetical protein
MANNSYPITTDFESDKSITTTDELKNWIDSQITAYREHLQREEGGAEWFESGDIDGVQYVATSLKYDSQSGALVQTGTAPNYFGGLWSLATCKHRMRGHGKSGYNFPEKFKLVDEEQGLYRPTHPLLVYTATGKSGYNSERKQWLASVALVTHGFMTVSDYSRYLIDECSEAQSRYRLTRVPKEDRPSEALSHGDCHANREGITGGPPKGHDHHEQTGGSCGCGSSHDELTDDNAKDHMKCLSLGGFWYAWETPEFWRTAGGRDGYIYSKIPDRIHELGGGVPVEEGIQ